MDKNKLAEQLATRPISFADDKRLYVIWRTENDTIEEGDAPCGTAWYYEIYYLDDMYDVIHDMKESNDGGMCTSFNPLDAIEMAMEQ